MSFRCWFQEGLGGFNRFCLVPLVLSVHIARILLTVFGLTALAVGVGSEGVDDALDYEVV